MAPTTEKAKICILTSEHQATDQRIFHKQAISLSKVGYEIHVYGKHPCDELISKIQIHSVRRSKNRLLRKLTASWQFYFKVIKKDYDIFHFHDPDLIPCGLLLKLFGNKVIMDVHEDFKETILHKRQYLPKNVRAFIATIIDRVEKAAASFFSETVVVTEEIAEKFFPSNVVIVKNFPLSQKRKRHKGTNDKPLQIIYTGQVGITRGCWELLYGFEQLHNRFTNAQLKIIGPIGDRKLEQKFRAKAAEIQAVEISGYLPFEQVQSIQCKADVGILISKFKTESHLPSYPVKLFEYMAAGLPVVLSKKKFFEEMMKIAEFGIILPDNTPENLSDALFRLAVNPQLRIQLGQNGKKLVKKHYSWQNEFANLKLCYNRVLNS